MRKLKRSIFKISTYIRPVTKLLKKNERQFPDSPGRILLVKTHAIGDTIMITPAIKALRNRYPNAHIGLLTGLSSMKIIQGNTDIDELLAFDESALFAPKPTEIIKLIYRVRMKKFDMAFIFQYSTLIHLLVKAFGIPFRIGFDMDGSGFSLTRSVPWNVSGERWTGDVFLDLARLAGAEITDKRHKIHISEGDIKFADDFLKSNRITDKDILVGIFPGGGKNTRDIVYHKRWGIEKYAAIIDMLSANYNAKIIVFGSSDEENLASALLKLSRTEIISACGKTNLKQLSALIKKCSLFITNDSAPLHIAIAMDTPTVSLFGPSRAKSIIEENEKHVAIQSTYPCSPCYCNSVFPGCEKPECMEAIGINEVIIAVERQLGKLCMIKG
ncbi:MAG: glycosyltransferase family 9 protein [Planctomycetes bacterium]|nr:glycosyltransferase family 9 protein [Planctomycetota bacterium]